MFIVFFGSVILKDSPLTAVQMLWVNLIMDTLAALALATEPPDDDILMRKPQPSSKSIVTELMWRNVYGHAIYQIVVLVTIIFVAQGGLVERYDVKCLADKVQVGDNFSCPEGGLNPFFAATLFHGEDWVHRSADSTAPDPAATAALTEEEKKAAAREALNAMRYWPERMKDKMEAKHFDATAWARYQCHYLMKKFEKDVSAAECYADNEAFKALSRKVMPATGAAPAELASRLHLQMKAGDKGA